MSWCGLSHGSADSKKILFGGNHSRGGSGNTVWPTEFCLFQLGPGHALLSAHGGIFQWAASCRMARADSNHRGETACALRLACGDTLSPGVCLGPQGWPWERLSDSLAFHTREASLTEPWCDDRFSSWSDTPETRSVSETVLEEPFEPVVKGTDSFLNYFGPKSSFALLATGLGGLQP